MWFKFILILPRFDLKYLIKDIETIKTIKTQNLGKNCHVTKFADDINILRFYI